MRVLTVTFVTMLIAAVPVAKADLVTIVDNTGAPQTAPLTDGATPYYVQNNTNHTTSGWVANGIHVELSEPMLISRIAGVMANLGSVSIWAASTKHINVFSSEAAFGANPLEGDVYHINQGVSIANLELIDGFMIPPPIGSSNYFAWPNRWVEFDFEPFELPAGNFIISVQINIIGTSLVAWSGLMAPNSHPPDIWKHYAFEPGEWVEQSTLDGEISGNAAAIIQGTAVAPPKGPIGDLNGNGSVGVADLLILLAAWGDCDDCGNCPADLTGSCSVGVVDLLILLANWG